MSDNATIINYKGIQLNLKLTPLAIEMYGIEMARLAQAYPDGFATYAPACSTAALVYWGHYEHCKETDYPMVYNINDFIEWAVLSLKTSEGAIEIADIHLLYVKLSEA